MGGPRPGSACGLCPNGRKEGRERKRERDRKTLCGWAGRWPEGHNVTPKPSRKKEKETDSPGGRTTRCCVGVATGSNFLALLGTQTNLGGAWQAFRRRFASCEQALIACLLLGRESRLEGCEHAGGHRQQVRPAACATVIVQLASCYRKVACCTSITITHLDSLRSEFLSTGDFLTLWFQLGLYVLRCR